jgi:hypothetical protein
VGDPLMIDRRFCGPPDSANGGYACGAVAATIDAQPVEVTLRRPPPLERALRVQIDGAGVAVLDDDEVVAHARPAELTADPPPAVRLADAARAASMFDRARYAAEHPFPTCFTCGPSRPARDGLEIFPAPIGEGHELVAWPWVPGPPLAGPDGRVESPIVWAALDCPSGLVWLDDPAEGPAVLGRMTAVVHRRPEVGEELVVGGWRVARQGRKLLSGSAVWAEDGELVALNAATWIRLTDASRATFNVAT